MSDPPKVEYVLNPNDQTHIRVKILKDDSNGVGESLDIYKYAIIFISDLVKTSSSGYSKKVVFSDNVSNDIVNVDFSLSSSDAVNGKAFKITGILVPQSSSSTNGTFDPMEVTYYKVPIFSKADDLAGSDADYSFKVESATKISGTDPKGLLWIKIKYPPNLPNNMRNTHHHNRHHLIEDSLNLKTYDNASEMTDPWDSTIHKWEVDHTINSNNKEAISDFLINIVKTPLDENTSDIQVLSKKVKAETYYGQNPTTGLLVGKEHTVNSAPHNAKFINEFFISIDDDDNFVLNGGDTCEVSVYAQNGGGITQEVETVIAKINNKPNEFDSYQIHIHTLKNMTRIGDTDSSYESYDFTTEPVIELELTQKDWDSLFVENTTRVDVRIEELESDNDSIKSGTNAITKSFTNSVNTSFFQNSGNEKVSILLSNFEIKGSLDSANFPNVVLRSSTGLGAGFLKKESRYKITATPYNKDADNHWQAGDTSTILTIEPDNMNTIFAIKRAELLDDTGVRAYDNDIDKKFINNDSVEFYIQFDYCSDGLSNLSINNKGDLLDKFNLYYKLVYPNTQSLIQLETNDTISISSIVNNGNSLKFVVQIPSSIIDDDNQESVSKIELRLEVAEDSSSLSNFHYYSSNIQHTLVTPSNNIINQEFYDIYNTKDPSSRLIDANVSFGIQQNINGAKILKGFTTKKEFYTEAAEYKLTLDPESATANSVGYTYVIEQNDYNSTKTKLDKESLILKIYKKENDSYPVVPFKTVTINPNDLGADFPSNVDQDSKSNGLDLVIDSGLSGATLKIELWGLYEKMSGTELNMLHYLEDYVLYDYGSFKVDNVIAYGYHNNSHNARYNPYYMFLIKDSGFDVSDINLLKNGDAAQDSFTSIKDDFIFDTHYDDISHIITHDSYYKKSINDLALVSNSDSDSINLLIVTTNSSSPASYYDTSYLPTPVRVLDLNKNNSLFNFKDIVSYNRLTTLKDASSLEIGANVGDMSSVIQVDTGDIDNVLQITKFKINGISSTESIIKINEESSFPKVFYNNGGKIKLRYKMNNIPDGVISLYINYSGTTEETLATLISGNTQDLEVSYRAESVQYILLKVNSFSNTGNHHITLSHILIEPNKDMD